MPPPHTRHRGLYARPQHINPWVSNALLLPWQPNLIIPDDFLWHLWWCIALDSLLPCSRDRALGAWELFRFYFAIPHLSCRVESSKNCGKFLLRILSVDAQWHCVMKLCDGRLQVFVVRLSLTACVMCLPCFHTYTAYIIKPCMFYPSSSLVSHDTLRRTWISEKIQVLSACHVFVLYCTRGIPASIVCVALFPFLPLGGAGST